MGDVVGRVEVPRGPGGRGAGGSDPGPALVARPAPPRWRDRRLVGGVLLVLGCVLVGSRLLAAADQRVPVWALARDLAAGAVVGDDDVVPVPAAAPDLRAYVGVASGSPAGLVLTRDVAAGELLPVGAVRPAGSGQGRRLVTLAVEPLHAPPGLGHGERVDVWVTPREGTGASMPSSERVLDAVLVAQVDAGDGGLGAGDEVAVVLDLDVAQAELAVAAARRGAVDLVRVPSPGGTP